MVTLRQWKHDFQLQMREKKAIGGRKAKQAKYVLQII